MFHIIHLVIWRETLSASVSQQQQNLLMLTPGHPKYGCKYRVFAEDGEHCSRSSSWTWHIIRPHTLLLGWSLRGNRRRQSRRQSMAAIRLFRADWIALSSYRVPSEFPPQFQNVYPVSSTLCRIPKSNRRDINMITFVLSSFQNGGWKLSPYRNRRIWHGYRLASWEGQHRERFSLATRPRSIR